MMPKQIIPTDAQIRRCAAVLLERNEIVIEPTKLREIVEAEPTLCRCLKYYPNEGDSLDTFDRGYLMFAVAKSIGWDDWPSFSDGDRNGEFLRCLCDAGYIPGLTRDMMDIYDRGEAPAQKRARGESV
jgi:hypothetical protein